MNIKNLVALLGIAALSSSAFAQVGVDGLFGAEWTGASAKSVGFDPAAGEHNFSSASNVNKWVAYDVYTRGDADFLYVLIHAMPQAGDSWDTARSAGAFANLYFKTNPQSGTGTDLGIEVTNGRAFKPGVSGYSSAGMDATNYAFAIMTGTDSANGNIGGGIEMALSWNYLNTDPAGLGFLAPTEAVVLGLSQSWGYSVAGGSSYGLDRLGRVEAVPEPGTMIVGALAGIAALRKRMTRKK